MTTDHKECFTALGTTFIATRLWAVAGGTFLPMHQFIEMMRKSKKHVKKMVTHDGDSCKMNGIHHSAWSLLLCERCRVLSLISCTVFVKKLLKSDTGRTIFKAYVISTMMPFKSAFSFYHHHSFAYFLSKLDRMYEEWCHRSENVVLVCVPRKVLPLFYIKKFWIVLSLPYVISIWLTTCKWSLIRVKIIFESLIVSDEPRSKLPNTSYVESLIRIIRKMVRN